MQIFNVKPGHAVEHASCVARYQVCLFGPGWDICIGENCISENKSNTKGANFGTPTYGYLNADQSDFVVKDVECFQLIKVT